VSDKTLGLPDICLNHVVGSNGLLGAIPARADDLSAEAAVPSISFQ
jgi:hypothetical protein